ncbi:bifunctional ADP-dependent NAD(P)H-hydrate dehydratase/NAD(P)H-hydrate epimerase [Spiroplasma eriocheiris]|uniref:ADP-dependent (S)-NAD(P)H-hydrate dehydratase n=1 Tax=Spiroplasma eriocheiris TaxID=315358 RepID=A0A0H3XKB0_9MOLU|nr:bifunctional ADP-dependent NAD(P)H-hydrate dehydratase/NAD(P)H-hydrate epimerase [Spiroplasma eriocheiris]AHF57888.1 putative sugar kinase [Spiroplasma eriocheiris CCTCC M 207170]AKM54331.1 carbohydrate kinase [Spiroplasma eriocheiris]
MKYVGTSKMTYQLDEYFVKTLNYAPEELMARSARGLFNNLNFTHQNFLIVSNYGNNGGDGIALAALLATFDPTKEINVYICCTQTIFADKKTPQTSYWYHQAQTHNNIKFYFSPTPVTELIAKAETIIDCMFGVGFHGELGAEVAQIINNINAAKNKFIIACDLPSGINNDEKVIKQTAVKADLTVTFLTFKTAFTNYEIIPYLGKVVVWDLEFPTPDLTVIFETLFPNHHEFWIDNLKFPPRNVISHKGDYGSVLVWAGSETYPNTGVLVANSSVNMGSGLVYLATRETELNKMSGLTPEVIPVSLDNKELLATLLKNKISACGLGPGLGVKPQTLVMLEFMLANYPGPIIFDADGIKLLNASILKRVANRAIITPHPKEFAELLSQPVNTVLKNRAQLVKDFAKKYQVIVVLKGYQTIISDGDTLYYNSTGNPYMAMGGAGDVLTGIITSLVGQNYPLLTSAYQGVYFHGLVADEIAKTKKPVLPTDIIKNIGYLFNKLLNK